jgi:hypothetical protein
LKRNSVRVLVAAFVVLSASALLAAEVWNATDVAPDQCQEDIDHDHASMHPDLGWPAAEGVLQWASHFETTMQLKSLPQWQECGVDYYVGLAERRNAAIEYSQQSRPMILWMGNNHSTVKLRADPEVRREWTRQHDETAVIVARDERVKVFAFEERGTDDVLDREGMLNRLQDMNAVGQGESGKEYPLEYILENGTQAWYQILRDRPDIAIITGEECPHRLNAYIRFDYFGGAESTTSTIHVEGDCAAHIHNEMSERLITLRTEITIIRVLERMQALGASSSAIQQGKYHIKDLDGLAETYGFTIGIFDLEDRTFRAIKN